MIAYKDEDGVHIMSVNPSSISSIQGEIQKSTGKPVLDLIPIKASDIPKDKLEYLDIFGGRLIVDQAKKQADLDKQAAKQAARQAILDKLKITDQEFKSLLS